MSAPVYKIDIASSLGGSPIRTYYVPLKKIDATSAPLASNDDTQGYAPGSEWIDVTNDHAYVCVDNTTSAAIWKRTDNPTLPLSIAEGGTGTTTQSGARSALGLGTVATLASDTDGTLAANSDSRIATQKATKTYIDTAIAGVGGGSGGSASWIDSVVAVELSPGPPLKSTSPPSGPGIGGATDGDRVLLTIQSAAKDNGVWIVNTSGNWSRPSDFAGGDNATGKVFFCTGNGRWYACIGTNMSVGADAIIGTDGIGITDFAFWNTAIYFGDGYSIAPSNIGISGIGLVGKSTSGAGQAERIALGTGFSFSGTTLNCTIVGISDGDKGDITVSSGGSIWTIDAASVGYSKIQNVSGTDKVLGRSSAGAGTIEEITFTSFARQLCDDTSFSAMRTTLGLEIGVNVQAYDQELAALASVTSAANKLPYFNGTGSATTTDLSSFGRSLIDDADAAAARSTLSLGTMATQAASAVAITGGTITGLSSPSGSSDAATKGYVDGLIQGVKWKASVKVATTTNGTLATAYENGDTIDGVTLATGDRILIKNQSTASENGIYTVNASGAPTRATDADTGTELVSATVYVEQGTANADRAFVCTNDSVTLGSTSVAFVAFASTLGLATVATTGAFSDLTGVPSTFTPSSHTHNASDINAGTLAIARIPTGSNSSTVCIGNDSRLSDARTPTAHTHSVSEISDASAVGQAVVTAASQSAARTAIGAGTVTGVSVASANGVSGSSSGGATPALTISLGAITPTSVNALTFAAAAAGFTITGGTSSKTFTASNTLTLTGTDGSTLNIGAGGTLGSAAYTSTSAYAAASHSHALADLTQSGATTGQVPAWNGSAWAVSTQVREQSRPFRSRQQTA
ncbi:MAG: hypothetical protein U0744_02625 [Gemmataceae bacterium]